MNAEQTLARWQAEDDAARARHHGLARAPLPPEDLARLSGLELMRDMMLGRLPAPPITEVMDFLLVHVEHGQVVYQGRPARTFLNPMGTLHGGWYATLLDSALGCAVHTTVPAGRACTTLELKVNLVRAIGPEVPLVRAEGRVLHGGRQVATADARLVGPDGKLYAHATTTCLVFDLPSSTATACAA